MRLFSYKMSEDIGFSPNPFWDYLTLATSMPGLRRTKSVGDWVLGFSSVSLRKGRDPVGEEKLIYAMEITEKLPFTEYWRDPRFERKIPRSETGQAVDRCGDNIYRPSDIASNGFELVSNQNHNKEDMAHELPGRDVLVSNHFWYFGQSRTPLPEKARPTLAVGGSPYGVRTDDPELIRRLITYLEDYYPNGILDAPHEWEDDDESWEQRRSGIMPAASGSGTAG